MNNDISFGKFIKNKRLEKEISLRRFATMLGVSPVHMSNLENDKRPAPKEDVLERLVTLLLFSKDEQEELYDLAAKSKNAPTVSGDLPEYIMDNDIVRVALRTAKEVDATDEEWQEFISKLKARDANNKE